MSTSGGRKDDQAFASGIYIYEVCFAFFQNYANRLGDLDQVLSIVYIKFVRTEIEWIRFFLIYFNCKSIFTYSIQTRDMHLAIASRKYVIQATITIISTHRTSSCIEEFLPYKINVSTYYMRNFIDFNEHSTCVQLVQLVLDSSYVIYFVIFFGKKTTAADMNIVRYFEVHLKTYIVMAHEKKI